MSDKNEIVKDDFYTMVMKDSNSNKGIRGNINKPGNIIPTFEFQTSVELDNFIKFAQTYFARFCFSLLKLSGNCSVGQMRLIPWLDFTQEWDDEKLFKHFKINKKTQKYIYEFLPDYYELLGK